MISFLFQTSLLASLHHGQSRVCAVDDHTVGTVDVDGRCAKTRR